MKKLLIDHNTDGIFVALAENEKLVEIFVERNAESTNENGSWVGRIIVGRIKTILPGQFAFVDIGGKKNAFINLMKGHGLKAGQAVMVQVEKDAVGTKGMCVTLETTVKGRFIVLAKGQTGQTPNVGVSRKIIDLKESRRLKKIVNKHLPHGFSAIIRSNAAGQTTDTISGEIASLHKIHAEIISRAEFLKPPATLYPVSENAASEIATVSKNLLTDILSEEMEVHISTECDNFFEAQAKGIHEFLPNLKITRENLNLKRQIEKLEKEVRLPCGGFITIEQTEACVVIDVNTGSNVGKIDYSETVLETNLEAAVQIAAQLRLRNLSGIIIADFIDMPKEADKNRLLDVLAAEIKKDRIKTEVSGFVGLGMVLLTRRKTRPPIAELFEKNCPHCGGRGKIILF
ncbi:MAG: ribonuclease E/G [Clostridiales bacterium]|jgi:ribonuclease G|nr:ribonuclease E/G [Clostridiales bacterium]